MVVRSNYGTIPIKSQLRLDILFRPLGTSLSSDASKPTPMIPPIDYKQDLFALIERLKTGDQSAVGPAVEFTLGESRGVWHGRARAKICRNLKHLDIDERTKDRLVAVIVHRFETGNFSEQFKDQLTTAIRFRPSKLQQVATRLLGSEKDYVRRYAAWILNKITVSEQCAENSASKPIHRSH
jgi:hypothetical protein